MTLGIWRSSLKAAPFAIAIAVAHSAAAANRDVSLYGLTLRHELTVPHCPKGYASYQVDGPAPEISSPCWKEGAGLTDTNDWKGVEVYFPPGQVPGLSNDSSISVDLHDGLIGVISITTRGISGQDQAFRELRKKFGKPTTHSNDLMENGFGATYRVVNARWRMASGDEVDLLGAGNDVYHGFIVAATPEGISHTNEPFKNDSPPL
jgi:hypothetical protein